jgi:hypothetical protein
MYYLSKEVVFDKVINRQIEMFVVKERFAKYLFD